jgi:hypothetical protein
MNTRRLIFGLFCTVLLVSTLGFVAYKVVNKYHKSIPLADEKELKVTLEAGYGTVNVSRGDAATVINADIETESSQNLADLISYSKRNGVGYLNISVNADKEDREEKSSHSFKFSGFESNNWNMKFTDAVPISFDVELGLGKGNFDFTDLKVKDLNLSAGASSVYLKFDAPNKNVIEDMTIESGLSKFQGDRLCNANFNHMKFEGGVGSYVLDFSGELKKEVDVDIEVGLGSLTIIIPDNIGARIIYEKNWISHIDLDRSIAEQEENNYYTSNYASAKGKMNMRVEAGFGSVKIKRE